MGLLSGPRASRVDKQAAQAALAQPAHLHCQTTRRTNRAHHQPVLDGLRRQDQVRRDRFGRHCMFLNVENIPQYIFNNKQQQQRLLELAVLKFTRRTSRTER